jgi:hypothetical protein
MFFQASFQEMGASLSDGAVLHLAAALYAKENDALRGQLVRSNREEERPLLDLGPFADELDMRGFPAPRRWDDLPEPLRLIDQALAALPREYLGGNPLFIPTEAPGDPVISDPHNFLGWGLEYGRVTPSQQLVDAAIASALENADTPLAAAGGQNPNFTTAPELIATALEYLDVNLPPAGAQPQNPIHHADDPVASAVSHPYSRLAGDVGRDPNRPMIPELAAAAIAHPYAYLALGVAQNPRLFTWEL